MAAMAHPTDLGRRAVSNLPLVIGITGASGTIYGVRLLQILREAGVPTELIVSRSAEITMAHETDLKVAEVKALATRVHAPADIAAAIASGSFRDTRHDRGPVLDPQHVGDRVRRHIQPAHPRGGCGAEGEAAAGADAAGDPAA